MIRAYVIFADTTEPTQFYRGKGCKAAIVEVLTAEQFRALDCAAMLVNAIIQLQGKAPPPAANKTFDEDWPDADGGSPFPPPSQTPEHQRPTAHDPADPDGWRGGL